MKNILKNKDCKLKLEMILLIVERNLSYFELLRSMNVRYNLINLILYKYKMTQKEVKKERMKSNGIN